MTPMFAGFVWAAYFMKFARTRVMHKTFRRYTGIAASISAFHLERVEHVSYKRRYRCNGRDAPLAAYRAAVVLVNPLPDAAATKDVVAGALDGIAQHRVADGADQLLVRHGVVVFQRQLWDCTERG